MSRRLLVPVLLTSTVALLAGATAPEPLRLERKLVGPPAKRAQKELLLVKHTVGQPVRGRLEGPTHAAHSGFWGGNPGATATAVDRPPAGLPPSYRLDQNHPNPFNPRTTIAYALPREGRVQLKVFDVRGRQVAVLVDGVQPAGEHRVVFAPDGLASGVYLYRLTAPGYEQVRRLVLTR
jgi:hypothetical protein